MKEKRKRNKSEQAAAGERQPKRRPNERELEKREKRKVHGRLNASWKISCLAEVPKD